MQLFPDMGNVRILLSFQKKLDSINMVTVDIVESNGNSAKKMLVQFQFKNAEREIIEWLTETQYKNLKSLPLIEYCKIIPHPDLFLENTKN